MILRLIILFMTIYSSCEGAQPCIPRDFNFGGTVCVCNATYCDTIDPPDRVAEGQAIIYSSSLAGLRMRKSIMTFTNATRSPNRLTVNLRRTYQTIFGFGTAFTDAAGINVLSLDSRVQENLLRSYFSPDGIELNFGRVPIAGTDFSNHTYTYDDHEGDESLSKFNLTREDYEYKIPLVQRAQAMSGRPVKLLASAWSAPPWMKTNKDYSGYGFLLEKYYQQWADYHIKFLDAYKAEGLKFWGVTTGNEPMNGILPVNRFNSLGWTPRSQRAWIAKHLGPTVRGSQYNATKLIALDDQRFLLPWWIQMVFSDGETRSYIDGIGVHWYWDSIYPASTLTSTHLKYPDKFLLGTEACIGDKPWDVVKVQLGSWSRGEMYVSDIIEDLTHWVTGWIDWNLALDRGGGPNWANNFVDSAIIVNPETQEFYKQPTFYALGHFSKFITEGSKRVLLSRQRGASSPLQTVAFMRPDHAVVLVVFNGKDVDLPLVISDPKRGSLKLQIPKKSVHTILYW